MSEISRRLAETIKTSKMSYKELEEATGISSSAIQRYATGTTDKIPVDRLLKIVKVCNGSLVYVLCIEMNVEGRHIKKNV